MGQCDGMLKGDVHDTTGNGRVGGSGYQPIMPPVIVIMSMRSQSQGRSAGGLTQRSRFPAGVLPYAPMGARFQAALVDLAIVSVLMVVFIAVSVAVAIVVLTVIFVTAELASGVDQQATAYSIAFNTGQGLVVGLPVWTWLWFASWECSWRQASPEKMNMGIIVTDLERGRITFARASARYWLKYVSTVVLMIGWIMAAKSDKKQTLHDTPTGCIVLSGADHAGVRRNF